jgi:hypothetical protein
MKCQPCVDLCGKQWESSILPQCKIKDASDASCLSLRMWLSAVLVLILVPNHVWSSGKWIHSTDMFCKHSHQWHHHIAIDCKMANFRGRVIIAIFAGLLHAECRPRKCFYSEFPQKMLTCE